ncbi:MAG: alpha/beta hydrolase [Aestuariivita sp.]|nr:alpha/beta hydrolase [Aestuariivita sp.]
MITQKHKSGHVMAGGKSLEYSHLGPAPSESVTLVLLHEGLGCAALWRDFAEELQKATGFGILAYSRAGYGWSEVAELPRPLDYMTREARDALPDVLRILGVERCILIGHSDGATIAAIYAGSTFDRSVRGLVLLSPHFFAEEFCLNEIARMKTRYQTSNLRERMAKYHRDPDSVFWGWSDAWLHPDFRDWDVTDVIDYIRVPILAIQGRDDQFGTLSQIDVVSQRSYAPVDTLILNACRHSPFIDQADAVVDAVAEHCRRLC